MMDEIVKTLELMCDKENIHDKKLLLLAELVESKCDSLSSNQEELKRNLRETNNKLDKITSLLEKYEQDKISCPVYKNKEGYEKLSIFLKYPKVSLLVLLGTFSILSGMFSSSFLDLLKFLLK